MSSIGVPFYLTKNTKTASVSVELGLVCHCDQLYKIEGYSMSSVTREGNELIKY